jgi:hypothetical protein
LNTAKGVEFLALFVVSVVDDDEHRSPKVFVLFCFMEFVVVAMQAHRHGGEICLASEPGKGRTLSVLLPAAWI